MGKKTIRVKYTEDASIAAFSQSKGELLKLYPEDALKNIWGNVIVPLYKDGHFYYRKDLGNGEMLICGECYTCFTKERYQEELGTYEHEHRFSDIGFIEEDSLVDNDEGFTQDEWDKYKEEQETKLMEQNTPPPETPPRILRAYVVYWDDLAGRTIPVTDAEFIAEAENQGTIYSINDFQAAFNDDVINSVTCSVRFLFV